MFTIVPYYWENGCKEEGEAGILGDIPLFRGTYHKECETALKQIASLMLKTWHSLSLPDSNISKEIEYVGARKGFYIFPGWRKKVHIYDSV